MHRSESLVFTPAEHYKAPRSLAAPDGEHGGAVRAEAGSDGAFATDRLKLSYNGFSTVQDLLGDDTGCRSKTMRPFNW
jgi:hypothetical protein